MPGDGVHDTCPKCGSTTNHKRHSVRVKTVKDLGGEREVTYLELKCRGCDKHFLHKDIRNELMHNGVGMITVRLVQWIQNRRDEGMSLEKLSKVTWREQRVRLSVSTLHDNLHALEA